ncbi:MAG: DUF1552 domain-containing protein [Planctomycetota bacterium]|nr:DUF1552 domain-containing protein [Planctomycetota bacterium]
MLRGTGAALALPLLDVMSQIGHAKELAGPPKRFACVFTPNGVYPPAWNPTETGTNYKLSPILEPLADVKGEVTVLSGIDNTAAKGHVRATSAFLTGSVMNNGKHTVSLDQLIAQTIGSQTRLPSIELGTEPPRQGGSEGLPIAFANTVSWSSPTTRLSPEINPRVAFDRMFRAADSKRQAEDTQSVIDLALEDAKRLNSRISQADRHKLDEYFTSVRSVEKRIAAALEPKARSWTPPNQPKLDRPAPGIPKERNVHLKLMMDLLVLAFQTDTTRVATLMNAHGFSRQNFTFIGVKGDHHTISHHKNQKNWTDDYTTVSRWYVEQFAYLVKRLSQIDEGGTSLLDNSMLLYGSGLKDGNGHVTKDLPLLLAGRAGGSIAAGRHLACPKGTPIANLHLSMLQRMDIPAEKFNMSTGTIDLG